MRLLVVAIIHVFRSAFGLVRSGFGLATPVEARTRAPSPEVT